MITKNTFYFLFLITIVNINCSFLVFPLKSFKKNNIDIPPENYKQIKQYLEPDFTAASFLKNWFIKTIYTEISVGSPSRNLITDILTNSTMLICHQDEKYQKKENENIFSISQTTQGLSKLNQYKDTDLYSLTGDISDQVHFAFTNDLSNKNYKTSTVEFPFFVGAHYLTIPDGTDKIDIKKLNITFSFVMGLDIPYNVLSNPSKTDFIHNLKSNDYIDSYDFTLEFYDNPKIENDKDSDEIGRLIFGKFDKLYNKEKYPDCNLRTTKLVAPYTTVKYIITLSEVFMETKKGKKSERQIVSVQDTAEFVFEQSLITGTDAYEKIIQEYLFKDNMCRKEKANSYYSLGNREYDAFICDKDLITKNKDEFPTLKIYSRDLNFTFEFDYNDLFREYNDKVYFMVIFPRNMYTNNIWSFGKIFMKKYQVYFNIDSKVMKFYYENKEVKVEKESTGLKVIKIICEIIVAIAIAITAYYLGKKINKRRKLRASELDDTYEYEAVGKNTKIELN